MPRVRLRPVADLLQGVDERGGGRAEIDVRDVEYFHAWLLELTVGLGSGPGSLP